ncbi:restriction endonuclease subunit S [Clostridium botulinum]|nr:restriction endonuclease subunit S [Clostridium botulinum]NFR87524.1 restriction endonuclease subunit S [Clostridium botulinum]NFR91815.1 restriction endonuclease subunit S [Clostridium botulinum]NFU00237.1 restriction endonuclease subunit S [Clostridium botulinum]
MVYWRKYSMTRNMKDSGVEWIGEIPEDWSIKKLKFVANIKSGEGITNNELSENGEFEVFGGNGVMGRCNKYNVECSRLIIGRVGALCGNVRYVTQKAYVSDNALILDLKDREIYKFYYYLLHGANLGRLNTSNAQPLITGTKVLNLYIPNINMKSQFKIAAFLDKKCTKIDQTIEKEKQVIEKLKEYKQSVITEAVTKGLNPDVPMKDSGVEWIGEIPEYWKIKKLKYEFRIKKNIAGKEGYKILSVTQNGIKIKDISKNDGQLAMDYSKYQLVDIDDFIMNHMDLLTGFVDCSKYQGVTSPDYRVFYLIDRNRDKNYYRYIFQSCYKNKIFYGLGQGVSFLGRWRLQSDKFLNFNIPIPPNNEQKEISDYLDKKCSAIDKIILTKEKVIKKLTECKKSLIYECVTGKREA